MDIEPAHIDQIRQAADGRFVEISADAGGVVDELKRIDKGFGVRFAENGNPPYWHVYHQSEDGLTTELVMSVRAHQTKTGVWTGLDQRVVKRVMKIGHSSYDYAAEVEKANRQAREAHRKEFREKIGESAELAAHAIRKDLGLRYKGRAFKPRDT